jgi:hypothetical protein
MMSRIVVLCRNRGIIGSSAALEIDFMPSPVASDSPGSDDESPAYRDRQRDTFCTRVQNLQRHDGARPGTVAQLKVQCPASARITPFVAPPSAATREFA